MNNTAFEVCTPEEEEFFREKQAHDDEQARRIEREQRADADTIEAMLEVAIAESKAVGCRGAVKVIYAAIKAGRIPGVVLGGGHE